MFDEDCTMNWIPEMFTLFIVMPLVVLSILWMPFAAATCAMIARERGLSAGRYSLLGGLYAFLFMVPSFYLIVRMFGRLPSHRIVTAFYVVLYLYWLVSLVIGRDALLRSKLEDIAADEELLSFLKYVPSAIVQTVTWVNLGTWAGSLAWLLQKEWRRILGRMPDTEPDSAGTIAPSMRYLLPIILLLLWSFFFEMVFVSHNFLE